MLKKIGLAVAVAAASASASADWLATGEGSELILNIWNETAGEEASLSLDLGYLTANGPLGNQNLSWSVDNAQIADIAGTADLSTLKWNVAGYDNRTIDSLADVDPYGLYITATSAPALTGYNTVAMDATAAASLSELETYLEGANNGNTTIVGGTANDALYKTTTSGSYAGNNNVFGENAFQISGAGWFATKTATTSGDSLYAYKFGQQVGNAGLEPSFAQSAGVWTFDATAGSLTYSAVPLPAAVWMFASGLLGMAGVARRRKKA